MIYDAHRIYTVYGKCVLHTSYIVIRIKNMRIYIFKNLHRNLYDTLITKMFGCPRGSYISIQSVKMILRFYENIMFCLGFLTSNHRKIISGGDYDSNKLSTETRMDYPPSYMLWTVISSFGRT